MSFALLARFAVDPAEMAFAVPQRRLEAAIRWLLRWTALRQRRPRRRHWFSRTDGVAVR